MMLQVEPETAIDVPFDVSDSSPLWGASHAALMAVRAAILTQFERGCFEHGIVVELFVKHYLRDYAAWPPDMVLRFDAWCLKERINFLVLLDTAQIDPLITEAIVVQWWDYNMKSLGRGLTIASALPSEGYDRVVLSAAQHSDADRREYFFSVVTDFHRLVVPRSITIKPSDSALEQVFATALHDESAKVRERAIVYAYGLGWVERLLPDIHRLTRDPVEAVRQYALVALGIAADDLSLEILFSALNSDLKPEAQSAIWALARHPAGLARLLSMLGDTRDWVVDDILGAIKNVSLPLTDEQLAAVRAKVNVPWQPHELERVFEQHVWRTRSPEGEELPPDRVIRFVTDPAPGPDRG